MEYDPELPIPSAGDPVRKYFQNEQEFMAVENYFQVYRNRQIRKTALRLYHRWCLRVDYSDALIPYLAMNYFDRYVSRHSLPNTESTTFMNLRLIAICCFTIAAKIRTQPLSACEFVHGQYQTIPNEKILEWELTILDGLNWRMRPVTAFCFVDFYYPRFSSLGFTRRSIIEIIIQFTSMNSFTRFLPSVMALSSLLAATQIAAPAKYEELRPKFQGEVTPHLADVCLAEMIDMCKKKKISIQTTGTNFAASTSTSTITPSAAGRVASEEATSTGTEPIPRRPGKQVLVPDESDRSHEIVSAAEDRPKKLFDFALLWEPGDGAIIIPPLVSQDTAAPSNGDEDSSEAGSVKTCECCGCECCNTDLVDGWCKCGCCIIM